MKKIFLGLALIATGFSVNAQKQFNIGLGGGIYSTWLVNKNVSDQGDDLDFAVTFSPQIGVNASYYFNEKLGLSTGLLFSGNSQKYQGEIKDGSGKILNSYEAKIKLSYLDVPLLLRFGGGKNGAYFEFGPQFGFLMGAKEEFESTPANSNFLFTDHTDKDVSDNLSGSNVAGVIGFGVDIDASENISITTGLRLGYGFTDVTKEYTDAEATALYLSDNLSFPSFWAHTDDDNNFKYKSTNRAFGGLFLAVMYKIPSGEKSSVPVPDTK
jgi:hypothetical protein